MNIGIKDGMVEFPYNTLGTRQYRSIVVEEIYPVMDIHPMGLLVRDIAYDEELSCLNSKILRSVSAIGMQIEPIL